ncbi:MAG: RecX family transcriptional regulator [Actinobacteria bacterium]|nr:RecX family transcriptional regulator [Actinomycetota bacterium]MDI6829870.1 RecX family transcriptional regulator [Actinomycetota bacterium]
MLSYRQRSSHEIREDLLARGFSSETARGVVEDLEARGLLDDAALARALVAAAQRSRRGSGRVYGELRRRGIGREVAEEAMRRAFDPDRESEDAARIVAAVLTERPHEDRAEALKKAAGLLARRGFSPSSISRALEGFRT